MKIIPWTTQEHRDVLRMTWDEYSRPENYGDKRTQTAFIRRKQHLLKGTVGVEVPVRQDESEVELAFQSDKKVGSLHWREASRWVQDGQAIKREMSESQDNSHFIFDEYRIKVITLADTHIGSWGTDYELFERITDEILSIPNLYVILAGDILHMAIRLRGVLEVSDNALPPSMQTAFFVSWLEDMQHRILFGGWDNHVMVRQEEATGMSQIADIMKRKVVYSNGIGHADITVGDQTYKIAMSHRFRGNSEVNPVYGPQKYLRDQGTDRDIAVAGDSHVPGIMRFFIGPNEKLAINCGSIQTNSGYAKRYFSLYTHPIFPAFVLDGTRSLMTPFNSVAEMQHVMGS